ncbi:MAG: phosphoribosylanthranilate isomerase [Bacteroidaceae bacterium]|nr:phosphoribosylanthranilate isomerase [Bacteroidaceae bacterium]MBO7588165.1 phosphoribosylanthranilate isomerase [Bacteroidaceae bacterium]
MIIKVCGMRDAQNIREVESIRPDMMGFMCWSGSKRYVSGRPGYLPDVCRVGVFVNPMADEVVLKVRELGLNRIQLHGTETPELCSAIHKATGLPIMKAIHVASASDFDVCSAFERADGVDMFLFDTKCSGWGGSGRSFDWSLLDRYQGCKPFLLAGGIGPGMEDSVSCIGHPQFAGIDLNSRFETEPGLKEIDKLSVFINNIRNYEQDK